MVQYRFPVVIEKDEDGYYAFCPDLQGCYTQGDTYEEALRNIEDCIRLHIEDRLVVSCINPLMLKYHNLSVNSGVFSATDLRD